MNENDKSKEQQLDELMELHERITELQKLEFERERIENDLRKIDEKIHNLFHNAKGVITIIQDRQIKYVNPQVTELIGYTPDEVVGTSFSHYIHPDELPKLAKYYLRRIAGEDVPNIYKTVIRHKNGSDVPIEIKASVVQYQGRLADFAIVRKIAEPDETS
jgi:PAS domain S-box-containing protein